MKVFLLFMVFLTKQTYSYSPADFFDGREDKKNNLNSLNYTIYSSSPTSQGSNPISLGSDRSTNKGRVIYSKTLPLAPMSPSLNNQPSLFEPNKETIISLLNEEEEENNEEDETQSISYSYEKEYGLAASFEKLYSIFSFKMK